MQLAALSETDGELDPGALEMDVEGHQGQPLLIELAAQFVDLAPMGQQPSGAQWVVVEVTARMAVGGDVHVVQLQFSVADQAEAVPQVGFAGADGFHFRSDQFDAGFEGFQNLVLMACLTVVRQKTVGRCPCRCRRGFLAPAFRHTCASVSRPYPELGTLPAWRSSPPMPAGGHRAARPCSMPSRCRRRLQPNPMTGCGLDA